jgi:outer membrane protein insertion porin family
MRRFLLVLLTSVLAATAWGIEPFVVKDIRVEGLQRISAGTVFNYLPVQVGDTLDTRLARRAIRDLYQTGFFKDVSLRRDGDVLVVSVVESPAIADITITGNDSIDDKPLMEALERVGFARGRVFNRSLLDKVEQELQRQYFALGRYGVKLRTTVTPLERNRVAIAIQIAEGRVAKIRQINIIGNETFKDKPLLRLFQLRRSNWLSFYTKDDQYSRQKLAADLESLRSFYLDRGYINFTIDSTQVSITPDKRDVYIAINLTEGDRYTVKDVNVTGDQVVPHEELRKLIKLKKGDTFSRQAVTETATAMGERLGKEGYAFANINAAPEIDEAEKQVSLTFVVDPGRRVYVRRINFTGNSRTRDEVLRREMRQMEGTILSTEKVNLSRTRLDRLGYFEEVNVETPAVPGTADEVDINFGVTEKPSGNLLAGVGYSQTQGIVVNASVSQDNFLGSGKRVSLSFNNSQVNTVYSFSYTNPYYTINGVSRGFGLFYRETDAGEANIARYVTDTYGGNIRYGIPTSEFDTIRVGLEPEHIKVDVTSSTPPEYLEFLNENGDEFTVLKLTGGWSHDTRNRALLPDRGMLTNVSGETAVPGGDLQYYKVSFQNLWLRPLTKSLTLSLNGSVAYGNGLGGTTELPFFENYYVGGIRSVRGYKGNTLGPRSVVTDDPLGGNLKIVGNAELFFPPPFLRDQKGLRMGLFVDAGNVYGTGQDFDAGELRYSAGFSTQWLSPLGPLEFALAAPLNAQDEDETEFFQFSIGTTF